MPIDYLNKTTPKKINLLKLGQTIKCNPVYDTEWRKLNVISRAGKATGKNEYLMNVVIEQDELFWIDFEHGVSEWKTSEVEQTIYEYTSCSSCDEENNDFLF